MPIDQNNSNEDQSAESKISRLLGESPGLTRRTSSFAKDGEFHAAMARAAAGAPADATPTAILSGATRAVAELVGPDRELMVRRARVAARTPVLQAREGMKHAAMQQLFVDEFVRRGHRREQARLVAGIGTACVFEALTRWLDDPDAGSLVAALDGVEAEVRALVSSPSGKGAGESDPVRA